MVDQKGVVRVAAAGDLPVLEDDGDLIRDAQAILVHLAEKHHTAWLAPTDRWLDFAGREMDLLSQARLVSLLGLPGDLAALRKAGRRSLRALTCP